MICHPGMAYIELRRQRRLRLARLRCVSPLSSAVPLLDPILRNGARRTPDSPFSSDFGCLVSACFIAGSRVEAKVPQYWADLIQRCKHPVPAERPTFAEIAEDIGRQNKASLMDMMLENQENARRESQLLHNILPPRVAVRTAIPNQPSD